jgi:hypothetical protein
MIRSLAMPGRQRHEYLQRQAEIFDYIQARNANAAKCHRQATLQRLQDLGIKIASLCCCHLE